MERIKSNTGRRKVGQIKRGGSVGQAQRSVVGHCCCVAWEGLQVGVVGGSGVLRLGVRFPVFSGSGRVTRITGNSVLVVK